MIKVRYPRAWLVVGGVLALGIAIVALALSALDSPTGTSVTVNDVAVSTENDDDRARDLCQTTGLEAAREYDETAELLAAHPSTPAAFKRWEEGRYQAEGGPVVRAERRAPTTSEFLALCYFEGTIFPFPGSPPHLTEGAAPPSSPTNWTRLGLTVSDEGEVTVYVVGTRETLNTSEERPPKS